MGNETHSKWRIVVEDGACRDLAAVHRDSARQDLKYKILRKLGRDPLHNGEALGPNPRLRRLLTGYFRVAYSVDEAARCVHILAISRRIGVREVVEESERDEPAQ